MSIVQYYGTGRRKTSIARVYLRPGKGEVKLIVNKRKRVFDEYFPLKIHKITINKPLSITSTMDNFDIFINVKGGGISSQTDAIKLGLARALLEFNPELRAQLKKAGLLTRDAREKERKKYGLLKARKATQYHKR
ncbi:MAG: 30S ribosomal protein S9 [Candidatus Aminicenantes bacterium]|nr:30S ribosomal protein S9 [Candidatus Aminicenantes bacterium]NIM85161.1 30S ribosomal protein S9 [Candidatus Aminicenantes bacterium]NIN24673.1 30S ribosomal protein S9 [Candidatus Aminicenantes bacterium]NIN48434.1 30S ribosomal protein S9 [Candidatus Aminicenantes bacterium]NIN87664.1 30S ribosomal protein S9 [Candidatus Aminicenantes bacterium]